MGRFPFQYHYIAGNVGKYTYGDGGESALGGERKEEEGGGGINRGVFCF